MAYSNENAEKAKDYIDSLRVELEDANEFLAEKEDRIAELEEEIDGLKIRLEEAQEEIKSSQSQLSCSDETIASLEEQNKQLKQTYQIC